MVNFEKLISFVVDNNLFLEIHTTKDMIIFYISDDDLMTYISVEIPLSDFDSECVKALDWIKDYDKTNQN